LISVCSFVLAVQIPESPKYKYINRRYDETREILKEVALKNKADVTNDEIDSIVFEFEGSEISEKLVVNTES